MANLGLSGLATGLDTRALITQLMAIERRPITLMEKTQAQARTRVDLYRQINTQLVALQRSAEKVMGAKFNGSTAPGAIVADPSKASATADSTAATGLYNVDVLSLAKKQITGGGLFTGPTGGFTVSPPGVYNATVNPGAPAGTYAIDVQQLAQAQKTGGGAFNAPVLTASGYNTRINAVTVDSSAAFGSQTYNLSNIRTFRAEVSRGQDTVDLGGVGTKTGTLRLTKADGSFVDIDLTAAENNRTAVLNKIKAQSDAFGITATLSSNRLQFTGSDGSDFTITGTARTLDAIGLGTSSTSTATITANRVSTVTAAQQARVTIGGTTYLSDDNTFSAAETGLTGVSFNVNATTGSTTLTVENRTGTLRITGGTPADIAITDGMSITDVRDAINAANAGMTAAVVGGRLELTATTTGTAYTVADAAGGDALASWLGIDSATKEIQAAQQARLSVNGGAAITSDTNTFTNPIAGVTIDALATGTSTLTIDDGAGTLRITNDTAGTFTDVAIAGGMTITQVRNAINAANTGMTATIQSGRLVLTGNNVGEQFTIADADGGSTLAGALGIDSTIDIIQEASLASISIDGGPAITGSSDTFTGAIAGVTIQALAPGSTTIEVKAGAGGTAQDEAEKKATLDAIRGLVTQFNDVIGYIKGQSTYDASTKKAGALLGDPLARDLRSGLTRMFNEVVDDASAFRTAHSVGIQLQRDGTLKIDEDKLKKALETDPTQLRALFTNEDGLSYTDAHGLNVKRNSLGATNSPAVGDGIANRLIAYIDSMVSSASAYNGGDANGIRMRGGLLRSISAAEANIEDLNKQIEAYQRRLEQREGTLLAKFTAMEKVVAMMRNQGSYMANQYMSMSGQ